MAGVKKIKNMKLDGGFPCLDYVNSGVDTEKGVTVERLNSYEDLLNLALAMNIVNRPDYKSLQAQSRNSPKEAAAMLLKARKIRADMYHVLESVATRTLKQLDSKVIERFNRCIKWAGALQNFEARGNALRLQWTRESPGLSLPVRAFIVSAYDLLTTHDQGMIKKCAGCEWLFLDTSKSHRRKWCSMESCGSITKSKRYYRKITKAL